MQVIFLERLCESDLSGQCPCVCHRLAVESDNLALLRPVQIRCVINADDHHLVIGQKFPSNRLPEAELVKNPAKLGFIVH